MQTWSVIVLSCFWFNVNQRKIGSTRGKMICQPHCNLNTWPSRNNSTITSALGECRRGSVRTLGLGTHGLFSSYRLLGKTTDLNSRLRWPCVLQWVVKLYLHLQRHVTQSPLLCSTKYSSVNILKKGKGVWSRDGGETHSYWASLNACLCLIKILHVVVWHYPHLYRKKLRLSFSVRLSTSQLMTELGFIWI